MLSLAFDRRCGRPEPSLVDVLRKYITPGVRNDGGSHAEMSSICAGHRTVSDLVQAIAEMCTRGVGRSPCHQHKFMGFKLSFLSPLLTR